jgi:ATP-binding cassette subfamily C protein
MAGLEVVSVGSIMPFLQVASDPASVHENPYLTWAFETFGFDNTNNFLIALGVGALAALVVSNVFIIFTTWALERYVWRCNHSLSLRLLHRYITRPYWYFIMNNSSELKKNILGEVREISSQMLLPALRGLAKFIVAISIILFLFFVDPIVSLIVAITLSSAYTFVYVIVKSSLKRIGKERVNSNTKRYTYAKEALGGIKQLKILGREENFVEKYRSQSKRYSKSQAIYRVIKKSPKYILETISFGGIIIIAIYLISVRGGMDEVIPTLGLYAFAGYRIMPALQRTFSGIASTKFNVSALNKIHEDMNDNSRRESYADGKSKVGKNVRSMKMKDKIKMERVSYSYPGARKAAIKNLTLEISRKEIVGFVGKTGSGKTTIVDIILGLLRPQKGKVKIDGTCLKEKNVDMWQKNIGYVSQKIYLMDSSIAENIAYGVRGDNIDMSKVRDAARKAHIYDFIERDLPSQWSTEVGEQGVKLSGGQKQRIGIARALYHRPSILVFDEATSALDQETEASIMNEIYDMEEDRTVIVISHRLSTVQRADKIIMIEDGKKVGEGKYDKMINRNNKFKSMALSR